MKTNQDRKTLLFAAGGVTGLIVVTVLALGLGFNDFASAQSPTASAVPMPEMIAPTNTPDAAANDQLAQVQDQNAQLRQAVTLMQERETVYRQQLEQASRRLQTLQATPVQAAAGWAGQYTGDPDGDEDHEAYDDHDDDHDNDDESHEHEEREHDDD